MVAGYSNGVADGSSNGHRNVDMRSDTVTQPTPGMREAMANAEVGDDVFGDDPTVQQLEKRVAELLGKEAGLFVTSGTQGNLLAVGTHCSGRGDEVLCGKDSHIFFYEQGGSSSLMGVVYNTFPNKPDGTLDLEEVAKYIRPDNDHFSSAKLLALENTQNKLGGLVLPVGYMEKAGEFCKAHGLRLHVDGARLWNAAVALGLPPAELVKPADSVNVCLSKGLGAPVGSVLVGTAEFIHKARRLRKAVGGGLRQVGILAAAGLYALDHNLARLKEDHENASRLAQGLTDLGLKVLPAPTNLVFFDVDNAPAVVKALGDKGIRMLCLDGKRRCRAVANLHVTASDVEYTLAQLSEVLK
ncbi:THA2 [Symbiodinium sp. KB8]|nr:THA2 [Symbiodinium sp. KB8]